MNSKSLVEQTFQKLCSGDFTFENNVVDIKGEWYSNINKPNWKDDLTKDVCSLANTIQKRSHLIFGLKENHPHLNSISIKEDEATIQQIIRSRLNPVPKISFSSVKIEDHNLYVMSISGNLEELPYFAKKSDNNHYIYVRRGSSTDQCRKEDLQRILKAKREAMLSIEVEADALSRLKEIRYKFRNDELDNFLNLLHELNQYTENYTLKIDREVISCIYEAEMRLRLKSYVEITKKLKEVAFNALYPIHQKLRANYTIPQEKLELLEDGINLCHQICYRGIKRQQIPRVVGCGVYLLRTILRYARLNELGQVQQKSLALFDRLKQAAIEYEFEDAARWIQFKKEDALALDQNELPDLPRDLLDKFGI